MFPSSSYLLSITTLCDTIMSFRIHIYSIYLIYHISFHLAGKNHVGPAERRAKTIVWRGLLRKRTAFLGEIYKSGNLISYSTHSAFLVYLVYMPWFKILFPNAKAIIGCVFRVLCVI